MRKALVWLLSAAFAASVGCGPGYRVIRSDDQLDFTPGRWLLLPSSGVAGPEFDDALLLALNRDAGGFVFERGTAVEPGGFALQVRVQEIDSSPGRSYLKATMEVVGSDGATPDAIATEILLEGQQAEPGVRALAARASEHFLHFVHSREAHHH